VLHIFSEREFAVARLSVCHL